MNTKCDTLHYRLMLHIVGVYYFSPEMMNFFITKVKVGNAAETRARASPRTRPRDGENRNRLHVHVVVHRCSSRGVEFGIARISAEY